MKDHKNPYQTNKGGKIEAPKNVGANDPKPTVVKGGDLRIKKGGK